MQRPPEWESQAQQQMIYSNNFRQALTRVILGSALPQGKAVREAADRALAVTAKGRTRWSRAILMSRLKRQGITAAATRSKKPRVSVLRLKRRAVPSLLQREIKLLGRLIPGCEEEPLAVIMEEAIDYISALQMQVRAMNAFLNVLAASASSGDGASSG